MPSGQPTGVPTTSKPTIAPTPIPTAVPTLFITTTSRPTSSPSGAPTITPSCVPTGQPSLEPSGAPSSIPTNPSNAPSTEPSLRPTPSATEELVVPPLTEIHMSDNNPFGFVGAMFAALFYIFGILDEDDCEKLEQVAQLDYFEYDDIYGSKKKDKLVEKHLEGAMKQRHINNTMYSPDGNKRRRRKDERHCEHFEEMKQGECDYEQEVRTRSIN